MGSVPGRNRRLESAVSILILAVLFLIAAGLLIKQAPRQAKDFSFLLPSGFKTLSEMEVYNAGNLYEKINGEAPLYIDAGFEKLSTQRFAGLSDRNLVAELYIFDMAAARNAFAVYSVQKRPNVEMLGGMQFAYKAGNAICLAHGRYYVKLIAFTESEQLSAAMAQVAKNISTSLPVHDDTGIPEIEYLPQDNLVPGSIKLYLANAFGFEGLTDTFTAKYTLDGETITAFLSKRAGKKDADVVAQSYRNFLTENGAKTKKPINKTLEGSVFDFYDMTEIVLSTGPFVAGIHEAENQQAAEKLIAKLIDKLSGKAKND